MRLSTFVPVRELVYRANFRGVLGPRECLVGHLPPWAWKQIEGRKSRPKALKVHKDASLTCIFG